MRRVAGLIFCLLLPMASLAKEAQFMALDPELEERANALSSELRCLVCQNQTIADSNAPLAKDLKQQVREQLKAGRTNDEIVDYMVQRYGDFVLYRPPVKATTILLWTGPALLLLGGGILLFVSMRSRIARSNATSELSVEDISRAERLLQSEQEGKA